MEGNRAKAYEELGVNLGTKFVLITEKNISEFEVEEHPFHPAVKYTLKWKKGLSGNHISDYIRIYMSYYFGGAYNDIKLRLKHQSIAECWDVFKDPNI